MQDFLKIFLVLLVAGVLYYLVFSYYKKKNNMENTFVYVFVVEKVLKNQFGHCWWLY